MSRCVYCGKDRPLVAGMSICKECKDAEHYPTNEVGLIGDLTKREYFAGILMQGLLANPCTAGRKTPDLAVVASHAADALLAELNKTKENL